MPNALKFEVYKAKNGEFRSRLVDRKGKALMFPVNGLPAEVKVEDVKFFRRNVQAALKEIARQASATEQQARSSPGSARLQAMREEAGKPKSRRAGKDSASTSPKA